MDYTKKPDFYKNPNWYKKRNKALKEDKDNGMSIAELCGKYRVTPNRIYSIIKIVERQENARKHS